MVNNFEARERAQLHRELAAELAEASAKHTLVPRLTARHPELEVTDSYAIQRLFADAQVKAGREIAGHKIGLTSRAMQDATGITEPDYGVVFRDMIAESGTVFEHARFTGVRVEAEFAFLLGAPLRGPGCSAADVLRATEYVLPALEILDAHVELEGRTIVDTIADNAAMGAMVLGLPFAPDDELARAGAVLYRNASIEETGLAAGVLGHPGTSVAWLVNKLAAHGDGLEAGEYVLSGSFTRPVWVRPGDTVFADYGSKGVVTCSFR